jgi:shikimate kinase
MGSGKSTHGRNLAKAFKVESIDLDGYIEKRVNKTVPEIFEQFGETFFREQETIAINEILEIKKEPCIISLGGGAVCFNNNMALVKANGLVIYLQTNESALRQRLMGSKNQRPLLKGMNEEEVLKFIKNKISEREKFYEQAHIKVNGLNLNTAKLIEAIEKFYGK